MKKLLLLLLVVGAENARAGTYGSFNRVQKGYTVSVDLPIGSMSGPDPGAAEAAALERRQDEMASELAPLFPFYEKVFRRVLEAAHPYKDWLGALDASRAKRHEEDYLARIPAPVRHKNDAMLRQPMWHLHLATKLSLIAQGRAIVGFALAQVFLGSDGFTWPEAPGTFREALSRVEKTDFYSGQAIAVAAGLLDPRATAPALVAILTDTTAPATEQLLARLMLHGKNLDVFADSDWALVTKAQKAGCDPRTLWTWVLLFATPGEMPALTAQLRQRVLVDADFGEELLGKK